MNNVTVNKKGLLMLLVIVIVSVGLFMYITKWQNENLTAKTTAVVIDFEEQWEPATGESNLSVTRYAPVLRYTVDGREYTATAMEFYEIKTCEIGDEVPVRYNPEKPEQVIVDEK